MKLEKILAGLSILATSCLADTVFTGNKVYETTSLPFMVDQVYDFEKQMSVDNPFTAFSVNFDLEGKDFTQNDTWYINLIDESGNIYGSAELDSQGDASIQLQYDKPSLSNSDATLTQSTVLYPLLVKKEYGIFELGTEQQISSGSFIEETVENAPTVRYDNGTDTDKDGLTDVQEEVLGLNPVQQDKIKQTYWVSKENENTVFNYQIKAVPGPSYTIFKANDLNGPWFVDKPEFRVNETQNITRQSIVTDKVFYKASIEFEGRTTNVE